MYGFWFFVCANTHFSYFLSLFYARMYLHMWNYICFYCLQSAQNRLLIKNGKVVNEDGMVDNDVYVEDGIIKWVLFTMGFLWLLRHCKFNPLAVQIRILYIFPHIANYTNSNLWHLCIVYLVSYNSYHIVNTPNVTEQTLICDI